MKLVINNFYNRFLRTPWKGASKLLVSFTVGDGFSLNMSKYGRNYK